MEINMRYVVKRQFTVITISLLGLLCMQMNAMRIGAGLYGQQNPIVPIKRQLALLPKDQGLVCQEGTAYCIPVKKGIFPMLDGMLEDWQNKNALPLDFPIQDIRNAVSIAEIYSRNSFQVAPLLKKYSLIEIMNAIKVLTYVTVSPKLLTICSQEIKDRIKSGNTTIPEILQFDPEYQKKILQPITDYLKLITIIKNKRNVISLKSDYPHLKSIVWSPNGNTIGAFGGISQMNGLSLWNIHNPSNILHTPISSENVNSISFSPDSTQLAFSERGLINILNIKLNETITIIDAQCDTIPSLIFVPKKISLEEDVFHIFYVAELDSGATSLHLLNLNTETSKTIADKLGKIKAIAISPNAELLAAHCQEDSKSYIELFDIRHLNDIRTLKRIQIPTSYAFASSPESITFSPDSSMILSTNNQVTNSLCLIDISNLHKIIPQTLEIPTEMIKKAKSFVSMIGNAVFTPDGKNIIVLENEALFLCNISNPNDVSYEYLGRCSEFAIAPTFAQGCRIISSQSLASYELQTLWTADEQKAFESLQNCSIEQLLFIGDLCVKLKQGSPINIKQGTEQWDTFESLSIELQNLLEGLLKARIKKTSGWFSGWWR